MTQPSPLTQPLALRALGASLLLLLVLWIWEAGQMLGGGAAGFVFGSHLIWAAPLLMLPLVIAAGRRATFRDEASARSGLSVSRTEFGCWILVLLGLLTHLIGTADSRQLGPMAVQLRMFENLGTLSWFLLYAVTATAAAFVFSRAALRGLEALLPDLAAGPRLAAAGIASAALFFTLFNVLSVFASGTGLW